MTILQKGDEKTLIFEFEENHRTLGTITCFPFTTEAILDCIQVAPEAQNRGIGTKLIQQLIDHLKRQGIKLLTFRYNTYDTTTAFLEKILQKTGWALPQLLVRRYFFNQYSFHPDWFFSPFPLLPKNCTLFPWNEVHDEEAALAKRWVESNPSLSSISPFDEPYPLHLSSLGLRYHGKLAGWMVNHLLDSGKLRYSAFYIIPELRGTGAALCLLRESIRTHFKNKIDLEACIEINFKHVSSSWIRFVKKRLAPSAFHTEEIHYSWISLSE